MGGGAGGFLYVRRGRFARGVVALAEPPLILKDEAGFPFLPPQTHLSPWA